MFEFIDVFHMTSVSTSKLLLNNLDKQILSWPINSRDSRRKCLFFFGHNYEQLPLLAEFQPRNVL